MRYFATVVLGNLLCILVCAAEPFEKPVAGPAVDATKPAAEAAPGPEAKPPAEAKDFEFRLAEVSVTRRMNYNTDRPGEAPTREQEINLRFQLYGPDGVEIASSYGYGNNPNGLPPEALSALKDAEGNDLRGKARLLFYVMGRSRKNADADKALCFGELSLFLDRARSAKTLGIVEGCVVVERTVETGNLEVRPLKDNLGKDLTLATGFLR